MKNLRSTARVVLLCAGIVSLIGRFGAVPTRAQQATPDRKAGYVSPPGYISGTVQGEKGPEAGVWVIAETKDLPTNFIKIVVTDDSGQYVAAQ